MKKHFLYAVAMIAALFSAIPSAHAVSPVTGTFDVVINLTPDCTVDTTAAVAGAVFNYTSFQPGNATFSTGFDVKCTNTLPITSVTLDSLAVIDAATNLSYTLALVGVPATGSGTIQTVTVNGTMALGQGGTCALALCTNAASANKTRTVTVVF